MQSLDVAIFKPLNPAFRKDCDFFFEKAYFAINYFIGCDLYNLYRLGNTATIQREVPASGIISIHPIVLLDFRTSIINDSTLNVIEQNQTTSTPKIYNLQLTSALVQLLTGTRNMIHTTLFLRQYKTMKIQLYLFIFKTFFF